MTANGRLPAALVVILALAFALAPFVTPPFTGYEPGQFPVAIPRPAIQPAGYAFAIWSVIYLWLILHAGFGLARRAEDPTWARTRLPLGLALGLGTLWLAIAGTSPEWATAVIWVMAVASLVAFLRAPVRPDTWTLSAPLAIFAGWLTAASAVSTGILLGGYGVLSNMWAALAMLALVLVIALAVQARKPRMPIYGLTIIWALVGVVITNAPNRPVVAAVAASGAVLLMAATVVLWHRS